MAVQHQTGVQGATCLVVATRLKHVVEVIGWIYISTLKYKRAWAPTHLRELALIYVIWIFKNEIGYLLKYNYYGQHRLIISSELSSKSDYAVYVVPLSRHFGSTPSYKENPYDPRK